MSLHDINKSHSSRKNPRPNTDDKVGTRMAHGTNSVNFVTDATDESLIRGIHSGFLTLVASYGAADGATVAGYSMPTGPGWILANSAQIIPHGLGYTPICIALVDYAGGGGNLVLTPYSKIQQRSVTEYAWTQLTVVVTATNISINSITQTNGTDVVGGTIVIPPYDFRIYLLRESASPAQLA